MKFQTPDVVAYCTSQVWQPNISPLVNPKKWTHLQPAGLLVYLNLRTAVTCNLPLLYSQYVEHADHTASVSVMDKVEVKPSAV